MPALPVMASWHSPENVGATGNHEQDVRSIVPDFEELVAAVSALKFSHPALGASKVHRAVRDAHRTWQVSLDRCKKAITKATCAASEAKGGHQLCDTADEPVLPLADAQKLSEWREWKAKGDALQIARDFGAAAQAYSRAIDAAKVLQKVHAVLFSNRAESNLELDRPLLALEDADKALNLGENAFVFRKSE